jgi:BRCA1-associated protein
LEYQYLLTAQLETQRTWFEDQIGQIEQQKEFKIKTLEQQKKMLLEQKAQMANRAKQLEAENLGLKLKTMEQDKLVSDLQEQVKDLMFFIEAQKTIASETGELKDGQVVFVPAPPSPSSSSTTPGKKKKGRGGKK